MTERDAQNEVAFRALEWLRALEEPGGSGVGVVIARAETEVDLIRAVRQLRKIREWDRSLMDKRGEGK